MTTTLKALSKKVRLTCKSGAKLAWDKQDNWQQSANGYRCTLHYQGRRFTFDYWQGIGISHNPTTEGCLDSLLSDSSASDDFEDFCDEFGYDTDSRKAERIWKACIKIRANMQRLLGQDFDTFMYAER